MAVAAAQWARLRPDQSAHIRRGAWYRVVKLTPVDAVLDVNGRPTAVPRPALQIVPAPPRHWTVVPRPVNAGARLPLSWGPRYAVCPQCRERARIDGKALSMRCPKCNGHFDVGWDGE